MAPNSKIFSLEGKGLKLDTKEDIEVHIKALREMQDVEEVRLLGNTLGVEACKVLGEVLETKKTLQVGFHVYNESVNSRTCADRLFARSQTWRIYLQGDYLMKFPKHCHTSSRLYSLYQICTQSTLTTTPLVSTHKLPSLLSCPRTCPFNTSS